MNAERFLNLKKRHAEIASNKHAHFSEWNSQSHLDVLELFDLIEQAREAIIEQCTGMYQLEGTGWCSPKCTAFLAATGGIPGAGDE